MPADAGQPEPTATAPRPIAMEFTAKLTARVHEADEGGYWAEVPALPGCVTEGDTLEEVEANLRDAAEGWLAIKAEMEDERKAAER